MEKLFNDTNFYLYEPIPESTIIGLITNTKYKNEKI